MNAFNIFFLFQSCFFFFEIVHLANLRPTCQFLERVGNTVSSLLMERKWTLQPLVFSFAVRLALDKDDIGKLSLGKTSVISSNQPNRRGWRQLFQTDWWAVNLRSIYSFRRTIYQRCQMLNLIFWKNLKKNLSNFLTWRKTIVWIFVTFERFSITNSSFWQLATLRLAKTSDDQHCLLLGNLLSLWQSLSNPWS